MGETLVVETSGFRDGGWLDVNGSPLTDAAKMTERFTRTGPDTILYRFTMEDPATFTAPITGELPFNRIDEQVFEYACHEGNYALMNILSGARAKEKEGEAKKPQQ